jgi:hypothetical protein
MTFDAHDQRSCATKSGTDASGSRCRNAAIYRGVSGCNVTALLQPSSLRTLFNAAMNRSISSCVL